MFKCQQIEEYLKVPSTNRGVTTVQNNNVQRVGPEFLSESTARYQQHRGRLVRLAAWKCLANVWAKVQPLSAKERLAAQAAEVEDTHKVTIRYRDGVDAKNRIVWKHNELTKTLEITGVIDQMARERYLILMCTEAV